MFFFKQNLEYCNLDLYFCNTSSHELKNLEQFESKTSFGVQKLYFFILLFSLLCSCFLCTESNRHWLNNRVFPGLIVHLRVGILIMLVQSL